MGAVEEASELAKDALRSTRERHEAGLEAWALRLAAEVTTQHEALDVPRAEDLYRQAMRKADNLGLRPLTARCHLGLSSLSSGPALADTLASAIAGTFQVSQQAALIRLSTLQIA